MCARRVLLVDVAGARTDDEGDLHLPVHAVTIARVHDVIVGTDDAVAELVEKDRLGRDLLPRLLGVVGVVEADGDESARAGDGSAEAHAGGCHRQALRIDATQLAEDGRRQIIAGEVAYMRGQIADGATAVDKAGLLRARVAKTHKLHGSALAAFVVGRKKGGKQQLKHSLSHYSAGGNSPLQFGPRQLGDGEVDLGVAVVAGEPGGRKGGPGDDPLQQAPAL